MRLIDIYTVITMAADEIRERQCPLNEFKEMSIFNDNGKCVFQIKHIDYLTRKAKYIEVNNKIANDFDINLMFSDEKKEEIFKVVKSLLQVDCKNMIEVMDVIERQIRIMKGE